MPEEEEITIKQYSMTQQPSNTTEYDERAERLGLSKKEEIKSVLATQEGSNVIFLDVRSEAEVAEKSMEEGGREVLYVPCTRDDVSMLESKASEILPEKNGKK